MWTQQPTDVIETYTVTVSTTLLGCEGEVPDMTSVLSPSEREFMTEELEEFSEVIVTLSASNVAGTGTSLQTITTMSTGTIGCLIKQDMCHSKGGLCETCAILKGTVRAI